ncbi:MAG: VOC family protein [Burkholderiaceae bacterium]|nr:VOC family protein [Burkholderiaceae bacterium]
MSQLLSTYPLITTPALQACRDFYVRHFGFEVGFEASWFVLLSRDTAGGAGTANLAFMHPEHPSSPPGPEVFSGQGMLLTLQTDDAAAEEARLREAGVTISYPLHDEPWGQRRFQVRDPAGMALDVVEQIAPEAGFWARYGVA